MKKSQLGWAKDLSRSSDIRGGEKEVRFMSGTTHSVSAADRFRLKEVEAGLEHLRSRMEKGGISREPRRPHVMTRRRGRSTST
jgi:hypothetical protein